VAVCQVCQKANPPGVEYCEDCGAAMTAVAESLPADAVGSPTAANSPRSSGGSPDDLSGPLMPAGPSGTVSSTSSAPQLTAPSTAEVGPAQATPTSAPAADGSQATAVDTAPTVAARPRLLVKRYGAVTDEEIPLQGERLVVGRFDPETGPVDVDLSGTPGAEHISRQHGELFRDQAGQWQVRDLGSTNGVFVKSGEAPFGPRITAPRALANGDEVAFGNARFIFRTD
jgi:pSer/pThr/pTyr-binding forkhead associated (FHA) protein